MTRRTFLAASAALVAAPAPSSTFGIATTCFMSFRKPKDTLEFINYVHALGGAGVQASLSSTEPDYVARVERRIKELGLYMEVMTSLPTVDMSKFIATAQAAKRIGALCLRAACLGGRRYETFNSLDDWKTFVTASREKIARAVPIAEQQKIPLALENHKDWTADEMLELLRSYSSLHLGVCLDTGNNISLLDDAMAVVEQLAPYALSTHIKDMGVTDTAEGFLLSEMPLGTGMLDIKGMVATIRRARPQTRLTLEMITRDPLAVPALTDKYWATFPNRNGQVLARTLRLVRERRQDLPRVSGLSPSDQLRIEEDNVKRCLRFAV